MKIGLVLPGFSANERDWCIPRCSTTVRVLAGRADVHVFTLRYPERAGTYDVFGATVHALNERAATGRARAGLLVARSGRDCEPSTAAGPSTPCTLLGRRAGLGWRPGRAAAGRAGGAVVGRRRAGRLPDIGYGLTLLPGRRMLLRLALRQAAAVTAGSAYLCELAQKQGAARRVEFAPLGVDNEQHELTK